jgi:hypothetical protein
VPWDVRHFVETVIDPLIETMIAEREFLENGNYRELRPIRSRPNDHELQRFVATRPNLWPNLQTHDDLLGALTGPESAKAADMLKGLIQTLEVQLKQLRQELVQRYSSSST